MRISRYVWVFIYATIRWGRMSIHSKWGGGSKSMDHFLAPIIHHPFGASWLLNVKQERGNRGQGLFHVDGPPLACGWFRRPKRSPLCIYRKPLGGPSSSQSPRGQQELIPNHVVPNKYAWLSMEHPWHQLVASFNATRKAYLACQNSLGMTYGLTGKYRQHPAKARKSIALAHFSCFSPSWKVRL